MSDLAALARRTGDVCAGSGLRYDEERSHASVLLARKGAAVS